MGAKTSDRGDNMSEANLQADGLVERPAPGAADWQEMEEEDSSLHNLLTCGLLPRGHLQAVLIRNYCLEIRVNLTDELGDTPPPLHAWMAPVVEDMLQEARARLMEAMVIGPGRAIFFYGRCIPWERV